MELSLKILGVVACCAVGLVFPLAFIGAAILAYGIYADVTKDHEGPSGARGRNGAASRMYRDKTAFRNSSESPAEEAFFDAMQKHFNLQVVDGKLVGDDAISLDMQVELLRYRLDFLVDKRLVVEVDGAQWHSSPEAVARDKKRDQDLSAEGYTILRIPAKLVFNDPGAAIEKVKQARKQVQLENESNAQARVKAAAAGGAPVGTPMQQIGGALRPKRMISAVGGALKSTSAFIDDLEKKAEKARLAQKRRDAEIARAQSPEMREALSRATSKELIDTLIYKREHSLLIRLMNAENPKEIADKYLRDKAESERRMREIDDDLPF